MPAIHVVQQVLGLADGTSSAIAVAAFRDPEEAKRVCHGRQQALQAELRLKLVRVTGEGEAEDTGKTLGQALQEFGIAGFTHRVDEMPLEDSRIVTAQSIPTNAPRLVRP